MDQYLVEARQDLKIAQEKIEGLQGLLADESSELTEEMREVLNLLQQDLVGLLEVLSPTSVDGTELFDGDEGV